jgi:hypothetical protein
MNEEKRFPVLVSDEEREWVQRGVRMVAGKVEGEKKRLEDLGLDPSPVDEAMAVIRGDGSNGGLVRRFAPRGQGDLLEVSPFGHVRILIHPGEEDSPLTMEPVDPDEWSSPEAMMERANTLVEELEQRVGQYFEDEEGRVFRMEATVSVAWNHVGERPVEEVDAILDAAEREYPEDFPDDAGDQDGDQDEEGALELVEWASDTARALARTALEDGIPLVPLNLVGSGKGGKVTKRDVLDYLEALEATSAA